MRLHRYILPLLLVLFSLADPTISYAQNVGIGTNTPNSSALLELLSTTKGLLIPRLTESQKFLVSTPATGLLIYQTNTSTLSPWIGTTPTLWYYSGTAWFPIVAVGTAWSLLGNSGTTAGTNFLGTTDIQDLQIRTNNLERARVLSGGNFNLTNTNNSAMELQFEEPSGSGTFYTGFHAGIQAANVIYTLPIADGSRTYQLSTNGAGILSWSVPGTAATNTKLFWFRGTGNKSLGSIGSNNLAGGDHALAAGYFNNTSTYNYAIARGYDNHPSGTAGTIAGGMHHQTAGNYSTIIGGQINYATGNYTVVSGGCYYHTPSGDYSVAWAGRNITTSAAAQYSMGWGWTNSLTTASTVSFSSDTLQCSVGIRKNNPSQALDVNGNIRFANALMPANLAGTSWQILTSAGAGTAPTWTTIGSGPSWSLRGDANTNPASYFLGTTDLQPLLVKTNGTERLRVLSGGFVGINTGGAITNQLQVLNSTATDEFAAIFGVATASTTNTATGIWGAATGVSATNTGSIGTLATGNANTTQSQTDIALQVADGEIDIGRTTQTSPGASIVEGATTGTAFTDQGPSGVLEFTLGAGGNLPTTAPSTNVFQSFPTITINNRYVKATSIILLNVESKTDDGNAPDPSLSEFIADIQSRAGGSFVLKVGMIPKVTSATNYQIADKIRIGYVVINPSL